MNRVWFNDPLETTAMFWRVLRGDGVTLGFTTHDRNLWFDGILHTASPGMVPSSIRKSADLEADSAEVRGTLSHDAINSIDLAAGRFDGAHVQIGLVDWKTLERHVLYAGTIGGVSEEDGAFSADLVSRKADLWRDTMPRTSPACRARFCEPGCNLNPQIYTTDRCVTALDITTNTAHFAGVDAALYIGGTLRWLDGPHAGITLRIVGSGYDENAGETLILDTPLDPAISVGTLARLRQGCDHTLGTCATRFDNAVNFRGEPFLPGNDMLTRYPCPHTMTARTRYDNGDDLASAALALIGKPFRLHGHDPSIGLDCLGVIVAACQRVGRTGPVPRHYTLRFATEPDLSAFMASAGLAPVTSPICAGDILMLRPGAGQVHLGIAANPHTWVHAHAALRRVVIGPIPHDWPLLQHWRLADLASATSL